MEVVVGIALSMGLGAGVMGFSLWIADYLLSAEDSPYVWPLRLVAFLALSFIFLNLNVWVGSFTRSSLQTDGARWRCLYRLGVGAGTCGALETTAFRWNSGVFGI